MVLVSDVNSQP